MWGDIRDGWQIAPASGVSFSGSSFKASVLSVRKCVHWRPPRSSRCPLNEDLWLHLDRWVDTVSAMFHLLTCLPLCAAHLSFPSIFWYRFWVNRVCVGGKKHAGCVKPGHQWLCLLSLTALVAVLSKAHSRQLHDGLCKAFLRCLLFLSPTSELFAESTRITRFVFGLGRLKWSTSLFFLSPFLFVPLMMPESRVLSPPNKRSDLPGYCFRWGARFQSALKSNYF